MSELIAGKVIIITGGTSGIGEACVRHFSNCGAKVVCASIQEKEGGALERELRGLGREVSFVPCDASDDASVRRFVQVAVERHGRIDGAMANAGVWKQGKVTSATRGDLDLLMGVNVMGPVWLAKHLVPIYERQGGGVLLITTSVAAHIGFPAHVLYCASKAGAEAVVRCLATDHAGVMRVVGLCPGTIDTPMLAASCAGWDKPKEEIYADVRKRIPVRRIGEPMDVARAAAFLLGDGAGYINGTSLVLDGGTMALPPW
ncbi:MAG TPA: SDR family oxidoreductase [Verrucomicrobiae bacterium]|nr:SDR family oxidoreductase [Verrucomicrobiae bacterium]